MYIKNLWKYIGNLLKPSGIWLGIYTTSVLQAKHPSVFFSVCIKRKSWLKSNLIFSIQLVVHSRSWGLILPIIASLFHRISSNTVEYRSSTIEYRRIPFEYRRRPFEYCRMSSNIVEWINIFKVWGRFGVGLGSVWDWSGVGLGSVWDWSGIGLGSVWDCFGVGLDWF